jgi:hypothetical protein
MYKYRYNNNNDRNTWNTKQFFYVGVALTLYRLLANLRLGAGRGEGEWVGVQHHCRVQVYVLLRLFAVYMCSVDLKPKKKILKSQCTSMFTT